MLKSYQSPEIFVLAIGSNDVVTASQYQADPFGKDYWDFGEGLLENQIG